MKIDIISEVKEIINTEISGLLKLREVLNSDIEKAINEIYRCRGKVILAGIGKAGLIAKKIASTMSSTGTPAVFVHPAEGMHGDLGIIEPDDIVIAISKSGESSELNSIIPIIKRIGANVICITGNKNSELSKISDITIYIGDITEACPFNLTPTTSATVILVIGDAIALTLMKLRKFNLDDFALFHPGGRLGKRLIMKVSDFMLSGKNNPVVELSSTVKEMILKISEKQAGAVSVVDENGKLAGLITDYDIRKVLEKETNIFSMQIQDIMNPAPTFIYEDEKAFKALEIMQKREKSITVLPVLNKNIMVVGMIRLQDLVKAGL